MDLPKADRRRYPRYGTDLEVYFQVKYDIKTRVEYRVVGPSGRGEAAPKRRGVCENVSAEGLCFVSDIKLARGDLLFLEVYGPSIKKPVGMEGRVCWSDELPADDKHVTRFHTGLQLVMVNEKSVADSVYFDKKYKVMWSAVLDSLFGNFSALHDK